MDFLSHFFGSPVPVLSPQELNEKLNKSDLPFVLDVREPVEYRQGHIGGATLIPLGELRQRMSELPTDKEIICVCASGSRSYSATQMLIGRGYNAINMDGGMATWQHARLNVKRGDDA
jgi:rhodanese-related sulfurtransferase